MRMPLGSTETPFQLTAMNFKKLDGISTDAPGSVSIDSIRSCRLVCDVNAKLNEMEGQWLVFYYSPFGPIRPLHGYGI